MTFSRATDTGAGISPIPADFVNNIYPIPGEAGVAARPGAIGKQEDDFEKRTKNVTIKNTGCAGLNGEDISRETRDNARAGGHLVQLKAMYNAEKQDSRGNSATGEIKNADNDLSTTAARKEQFLLNVRNTTSTASKQDSKGESTNENIDMDLSGEAIRREKFLQKKIENALRTNPDNTDNHEKINYGNVDPMVGSEGRNAMKIFYADDKFKNLDKSKSTLNKKEQAIYDNLTSAYSAGLNGTDITDKMKQMAANSGYLTYFENVYNAGVADSVSFTKTNKALKSISNAEDSLVVPVGGVEDDLLWRWDYPKYPDSKTDHEGRDLSKNKNKEAINWDKAIAMGNMVVIGTYGLNKNRPVYKTDDDGNYILDKDGNKIVDYYKNYLATGWGNCVVFGMEYNGEIYYIVYGHLDTLPDLQPGQILSKGDVVGQIGSTGHSSGDHLHISVIKDGKYIDPLTLFGRDKNDKYSDETKKILGGLISGTMNIYG